MAKDKDFNNAAKKLVAGQNDANEVSWTVRDAQILLSRLTEYIEADISRKAALHEKLSPAIKSLIAEFGIIGTIERMRRAIEMDRNRPRDISIYQFVRSPDLFDVGGAFSTFDVEIAKMKKKGSDAAQLRHQISDKVYNLPEVALYYIREFKKFIAENPDVYKEARANAVHGDRIMLEQFFQKLADALKANIGLTEIGLKVLVIDSWKNLPSSIKEHDKYVRNFDDNLCGVYLRHNDKAGNTYRFIVINRANIIKLNHGKTDSELFNKYCGSFFHEFAHFIDYTVANYGAVGCQKIWDSRLIYMLSEQDFTQYQVNPTEKSSYFIGESISYYLNQMANEK